MRNHSYENDFDLHENEAARRNHLHMKGFALRLVLKQRPERTRKWPMCALSLVNQLWVIAPINPRKNHSSSELLYKSNRPQVSMGYITIIPWARVGYEEIITSYLTRTNGIIVLVNSQTGFCRRFYFHNFTKSPERKFLNFAHYFPYDVKLRLLAHSRSFLANQKARNAIVGAENLLRPVIIAARS